jgi:hypothetical protein
MEIEALLTKYKNIESVYTQILGKVDALGRTIKQTEKMLRMTEDDLESKSSDLLLSEKGIEVVKKIISEFSKCGVEKLQGLLSYGLQSIFSDRKYSIEIEISDRGDLKTAELWLVEDVEGSILKTKLRDSVGGGIQVVVSLILRIYFIIVLNFRRFIIMDEALKEISDSYMDNLFNFLKHTSVELGFKYLWITQDLRFTDYADKVYDVVNGSAKDRG